MPAVREVALSTVLVATVLVGLPAAPSGAAGRTCAGRPVPAEAQAVDTSVPDEVIGNGSAASCTSQTVVQAIAQGGTITFDVPAPDLFCDGCESGDALGWD